MELAQYLQLLRKWLWLIVLATILAGGASFIVRASQRPMYQSAATVAIGRYIDAPNPNNADIQTGINLAQTYAQIVTTHDVLQTTIDALKLPLDVKELRKIIDTRIITGTSLLVIQVTYADPVRVADIANTLADQLIQHSPTNLTEQQQSQLKLANDQITALNAQVLEARQELSTVEQQLSTETDAKVIADLRSQRKDLIEQINGAAATIAQFSSTITGLQQRTNSLDVVERAQVPSDPSGLSVATITLLGAIVGASIAFGAALFFEYLDDKIRSSEQATLLLSLPVWASVVRFGKKKGTYPEHLITNKRLDSSVAESYRTLRANLIFANEDENKVFVVTSPGPVEGKSVTAANLAISLAQAGIRVLLIDADLRRPMVHQIFGAPNDVGLTTLLFADPSKLGKILHSETSDDDDTASLRALRNCIRQTDVPNLQIIPSGFIPANPAELLSSTLMQLWIDAFRESLLVDVIIMDSPPALVVSDASVLAANVKANVLMVINASKTRRVAAVKTKEQFEQLGVAIRGLVLNQVHPRDEDYGYGYGYSYYYTTPAPDGSPSKNGSHSQNGNSRPKKSKVGREQL